MEYCGGGDLSKYLKANGPIDIEDGSNSMNSKRESKSSSFVIATKMLDEIDKSTSNKRPPTSTLNGGKKMIFLLVFVMVMIVTMVITAAVHHTINTNAKLSRTPQPQPQPWKVELQTTTPNTSPTIAPTLRLSNSGCM